MDKPQPSDEELYARRFTAPTLPERRASWEALQRRYEHDLYAYFRQKLRDPLEAEDCVNELFLALMDDKAYRPDLRCFHAYLWTAAVNLGSRTLKRRTNRPKTSSPLEEAAARDPPELDRIVDTETWLAVEACRESLGQEQADFVVLHFCKGLTLDDAVRAVGWRLTRAGAKYRLQRCLERIRKCLKKKGFPEWHEANVLSDRTWRGTNHGGG